jgi:hypothetical protein
VSRVLRDANRTLADFGLPLPIGPELSHHLQAHEDLIPEAIDFTTGDPIELTTTERSERAENVRPF